MNQSRTRPTVVDVFVSSPSDMEEERDKLAEIVEDLNRISKHFVLRLIQWKTHSVPAIGTSPQEILNEELSPENADIYIGLMGARFGSATATAGSGTEEEFNRALERHKEKPSTNRIMFYFKTTSPSSLDDIDVCQLVKVRKFKSSLKSSGLIAEFDTLSQFERDIRVHLSRQVSYFHNPTEVVIAGGEIDSPATEPDDEPGYLDYLSMVGESSESLNEIVKVIVDETSAIGERLSQRTRDITAVNNRTAKGNNQMAHSKLLTLVNRAATDLTTYAASLRPKLPLFEEQLSSTTTAVSQAAMLSAIDLPDNSQNAETIRVLSSLRSQIDGAIAGMSSFRSSVVGLPRMTSKLNKSKRETAAVLQRLLHSLLSARDTIEEALQAIGDESDGSPAAAPKGGTPEAAAE